MYYLDKGTCVPSQLDLERDFMRDEEIHLHFPAGAISKDGPSAGVTILTVLVSLLADRCVRPDVAMTGEITLNGVVLPVSIHFTPYFAP